jgi:DegV family protein with EDD domain
MKEYIIITDSTTDLPDSFRVENNLKVVPLGFMIDGRNYHNYLDNHELSSKEFYQMIKEGKQAKTFQVNPEEFYEVFKSVIEQGYGILGIFFSSGLSGTFNSARIAKNQILEEYQDAEILIVDSLCASLGEGLLVHYAVKAKNEGKSLIENFNYVEDLKLSIAHWFTVMDMDTLKRGGRISSSAAFFAKTLNINPILHVSDEGKLVAKSKKIGRKNALNALVEQMMQTIDIKINDTIYISHAECEEDALKVVSLIRKYIPTLPIVVNQIGPVIGGHCGIGTVALFYIAKNR